LLIHGVTLGGSNAAKKIGTLLLVAAIFGIVNAILRPVVKVLGCWAYVLTLGLIALVVNGALFLLTSWIAGKLDLPFHVDKFWPTAVLGALLVSVISWLLNLLVPDRKEES
jgi:putative membrane protein